jgi:hypothetical protein
MDTLTESGNLADCHGPIDFSGQCAIIISFCVLGLLWAIFNFFLVKRVNVLETHDGEEGSLVEKLPEEQKKTLI